MAKKRKTSRSRKAARPKTARRQASRRRGAGGEADPMHVAAALLVLVLVGIGIYFYQLNHKPGDAATTSPPAVAVEKK
jgi:hypothetical protein